MPLALPRDVSLTYLEDLQFELENPAGRAINDGKRIFDPISGSSVSIPVAYRVRGVCGDENGPDSLIVLKRSTTINYLDPVRCTKVQAFTIATSIRMPNFQPFDTKEEIVRKAMDIAGYQNWRPYYDVLFHLS